MSSVFPEIVEPADKVTAIIKREEELFLRTLDFGTKRLGKVRVKCVVRWPVYAYSVIAAVVLFSHLRTGARSIAAQRGGQARHGGTRDLGLVNSIIV
jgi:hypothetical protein